MYLDARTAHDQSRMSHAVREEDLSDVPVHHPHGAKDAPAAHDDALRAAIARHIGGRQRDVTGAVANSMAVPEEHVHVI